MGCSNSKAVLAVDKDAAPRSSSSCLDVPYFRPCLLPLLRGRLRCMDCWVVGERIELTLHMQAIDREDCLASDVSLLVAACQQSGKSPCTSLTIRHWSDPSSFPAEVLTEIVKNLAALLPRLKAVEVLGAVEPIHEIEFPVSALVPIFQNAKGLQKFLCAFSLAGSPEDFGEWAKALKGCPSLQLLGCMIKGRPLFETTPEALASRVASIPVQSSPWEPVLEEVLPRVMTGKTPSRAVFWSKKKKGLQFMLRVSEYGLALSPQVSQLLLRSNLPRSQLEHMSFTLTFSEEEDLLHYATLCLGQTYRGVSFRFLPQVPSGSEEFYHPMMERAGLEFPEFWLTYTRRFSLQDPVVVDIILSTDYLAFWTRKERRVHQPFSLPEVLEHRMHRTILDDFGQYMAVESDLDRIQDFDAHASLVVALAKIKFDPETAKKEQWLEMIYSFAKEDCPSLTLLYSLISLWPFEVARLFL